MIRWLIRRRKKERDRKMAEFLRRTRESRRVQSIRLLRQIQRHSATEYGQRYGFSSIASVDSFRRAVPLSTYEDFRPYINRMVEGETNLLFESGDKLLMFASTSGTTGKAKLIPVTKTFMSEYQTAARLWNIFCFKDHPQVLDGKMLTIVSPTREEVTPGGVPIGSISGLIARKQKMLIRSLYAVPSCVSEIENATARYYTLMRLAIRGEVSFLSTPNPSTLQLVARLVDEQKEDIIRDLYDGSLKVKSEVPDQIFRRIRGRLKRAPERARQLEALVRDHNHLYPQAYWPQLALLACWKGGPLHLFIDGLKEYFGDVPVRDLGLMASEGRISVPITDQGSAGLLNIGSNFYEFLPVNEGEPAADSRTLLPHELERGRDYFLILTTSAGLYRYQIHDVIRVEGFEGTTPLISFLNKGRHISSITGEKLSEHQLTVAFQKTWPGTPPPFLACPAWDVTPYYTLVLEEQDTRQLRVRSAVLAQMDRRLQELNVEYACKRRSGRLGPLKLTVVETGSLQSQGFSEARTEQSKAVYLRPEVDYHKRFPVADRPEPRVYLHHNGYSRARRARSS